MKSLNEECVWRALADPVRREILDALAVRSLTTGEIVQQTNGLCRTAVMKHLDVLVDANLVIVRREGRFRWNDLNSAPIERVCSRWINQHVARLSSAMNRLKEIVESSDSSPPPS